MELNACCCHCVKRDGYLVDGAMENAGIVDGQNWHVGCSVADSEMMVSDHGIHQF